MSRHGIRVVLALLVITAGLATAHASWSVGVHFGVPLCYPRPYYGPVYVRPYYPVYVRPAPVIVEPVTIVQPVQTVQPAYSAPPPRLLQESHSPGDSSREADVERYLGKLQDADARERVEAATQLGRLRAHRALGNLTAGLNNDRSPQVREACAKALGLLGSTEALTALQKAAQADEDREVRRSASYAADVIRANYTRQ